jgi:hypothetical protein
MSRYWRIRMRAFDRDWTREAWERDEIGIWYGVWSAEDFRRAMDRRQTADPVQYLSNVPKQAALGWVPTKAYIDTARRFAALDTNDWVVVYFDEALHLGRPTGELESRADHPRNLASGEVFKFRKVSAKKMFRLSLLPDPYRLVPPAGRGNVHEFGETNRKLVEYLASSADEGEVTTKISKLSREDWLDLLGPSGWESLCHAYLILRDRFVPTGLMVGRTLPLFDIVGRTEEGKRVLGQCKKAPYAVAVDEEFLRACSEYPSEALFYYFAYRGCANAPKWLRVVTRDDIAKWLDEDPRGQWYSGMMFGS